MNRIFRLHNAGFGDHWASVQHVLWHAYLRNQPQLISMNGHSRERTHDIIASIDYHGPHIFLTDEAPTVHIDGFALWATLYRPTKVKWYFDPSYTIITYAFDGVSTPELKNPPAHDEQKIVSWIESKGYQAVKVGAHLGLDRTIKCLAKSILFVGVDAGVSHIAHSVGCPTMILEYDLPVVTCHRHKNYVLAKGADHFITQAENYLSFINSLRL